VVSPFAKPGYVATRHYSTASIVKTEELLMGLPPNNYGDLFATDLRDMFQSSYNGITAASVNFNTADTYVATAPGRRIWKLVSKLDSSGPDRDSRRLGALGDLSLRADLLCRTAQKCGRLRSAAYLAEQAQLYRLAEQVVSTGAPARDDDD
jgi:hypothetical protein